jgi:hypothetical protein
MWQMGLRPKTAFGCAMDFLMAPKDHILAAAAPLWKHLLDSTILVIGIQIRTGDLAMKGHHRNLSNYVAFFDCSDEIEASRSYPGQRVMWLLLSDSSTIRQSVKASYGDIVMVPHFNNTASQPDHLMPKNGGSNAGSRATIDLAVVEHWVYGYAVYFVMSRSRYSRTAYFRTLPS